MKEPVWVDRRALFLLHTESLAEHGGRAGVLDEARLELALARPQQIFRYEPKADLARLAAAYSIGLIRKHPFADSSKRAAFLAVGLFLGLNGFQFVADAADAAETMVVLAAGEMSEQRFGGVDSKSGEAPAARLSLCFSACSGINPTVVRRAAAHAASLPA